tara:strand:+ start:509 stop:949 length:441 start_codon:yes stop_codon:yes gene_type:complete
MKQLKKTAMLVGAFTQLFNRCSILPQDRKAAVSLALARHIAYACPLPTSEVHNVRTFFLENYQEEVNAFLSSVNEQFVVDVTAAMDLAFKLWSTRYKLVHVPSALSIESLLSMSDSKSFSDVEYNEKWNVFATQFSKTLDTFTQPE